MPSPVTTSYTHLPYKVEYEDPAGSFGGWFIHVSVFGAGGSPAQAETIAEVKARLKAMGFEAGTVTITSLIFNDGANYTAWTA